MFYYALENFGMNNTLGFIGFASAILPFSLYSITKAKAKAEKYQADELLGKEHKRNLLDKFLDRLISKNEAKEKKNKQGEKTFNKAELVDNCAKQM